MNQTDMLTQFVQRLDIDVVLWRGARYTVLDRQWNATCCRPASPAALIHRRRVFNSGLLADPRHQGTSPTNPRRRTDTASHQFHEVVTEDITLFHHPIPQAL